jgi:hypothetical protein
MNAWDSPPPGARFRYCGAAGNIQWSSWAGTQGAYVCDDDQCHEEAANESREIDEGGRDYP